MPSYEFTLMVTGIDEDKLDELFEATDGEATAEFGNPSANRVVFDTEADSLADAIVTAINQVETVPGLQVATVEGDELVWASEIAARTGRSRQNIDQLIQGERGPGDFPSPQVGNARNRLWRWSEVQKWFSLYEHVPFDDERPTVIGAVNGALEARNNLRQSADSRLALQLTKMVGEQTERR